jgi:hypothetical protein
VGLGRSRSCSWIVPIAHVGAALAAMRKQAEGCGAGGRRPGPKKSSSFDEAAVEAGLALPSKGARQGVSEAGPRPSHGRTRRKDGALAGRPSIRGLQVRAALVPCFPLGNRRTSTTVPKLGAHRQASLYPRSRRSPKLRLGGRPWKPSLEAKAEGGGDSGIERSAGYS